MTFTADLNSETVRQALRALQDSLADQSPALREIADDFRAMMAEQFASEGRAGGTPWAPLAPSTARRRRSGALLNVTGALLSSLRDVGAPRHVEQIDRQTLTLGSSLPYAMYHQTGAGAGYGQTHMPARVKGQRGMPMRPLIVLTPDRVERWTGLVQQALEEKTPLLGPKQLGL
jgi:phage gpG-like protein